jgi:hypothetical protein
MSTQTTAVPIYCCACQNQIMLPSTYEIVNGKRYHIGCDTPRGFAHVIDGKVEQDFYPPFVTKD